MNHFVPGVRLIILARQRVALGGVDELGAGLDAEDDHRSTSTATSFFEF